MKHVLGRLLGALAICALLSAALPDSVSSAAYVVTNTLDSGAGSLRAALALAGASPGPHTISFNIDTATDPGCSAGVCTISVQSELPSISRDEVTLDGYSQPGAAPATAFEAAQLVIEIDGALTEDANGLLISGDLNTVRGLAIKNFQRHGIYILGAGNTIAGNYIGLNAGGTIGQGNGMSGVLINDQPDNTIGGGTPADRNVISGNGHSGVTLSNDGATGNTIAGNYIGTNASGTSALPNDDDGVTITLDAEANLIGGDAAGEGNLISGNGRHGISILSPSSDLNVVSGNLIGTDATGMLDLGNYEYGVYVAAHTADVGGDTAGERNVISGNDTGGVRIYSSDAEYVEIFGNYIGLTADGSAALGNGYAGVEIYYSGNNTIGGASTSKRNVISGNYIGVLLIGSSSNFVSGNYIGTDSSGLAAVPNGSSGINMYDGSGYNTIGGWVLGQRNIISGNLGYGVQIGGDTTGHNTVSGNYIGLDASGNGVMGNTYAGVRLSAGTKNNVIGGPLAGEANVICGNYQGIYISGAYTSLNVVENNFIGVNATDLAGLGNFAEGILLDGDATENTIGPGNVISGNGYQGVRLQDATTALNVITQNSIYANTLAGIDLQAGANGGILPPTITQVTLNPVTVEGTACFDCTVELFGNATDAAEGREYLAATTADSSGDFSFVLAGLTHPYLTATATYIYQGTSEFSASYESPLEWLFLPLIAR